MFSTKGEMMRERSASAGSDGPFLRTARDVARQHTDIAYDERIVDAACMHLVMRPETFDVL